VPVPVDHRIDQPRASPDETGVFARFLCMLHERIPDFRVIEPLDLNEREETHIVFRSHHFGDVPGVLFTVLPDKLLKVSRPVGRGNPGRTVRVPSPQAFEIADRRPLGTRSLSEMFQEGLTASQENRAAVMGPWYDQGNAARLKPCRAVPAQAVPEQDGIIAFRGTVYGLLYLTPQLMRVYVGPQPCECHIHDMRGFRRGTVCRPCENLA